MTELSEPGETGEVADTVFTLLAKEDCQISSAFAASLRGSEISSFIKRVLMFGGRYEKETFNEKAFIVMLQNKGEENHRL